MKLNLGGTAQEEEIDCLSKALTENFCSPEAFALNKDSEQKKALYWNIQGHSLSYAVLKVLKKKKEKLCFSSMQTFGLEMKAQMSGLNRKNPLVNNGTIKVIMTSPCKKGLEIMKSI